MPPADASRRRMPRARYLHASRTRRPTAHSTSDVDGVAARCGATEIHDACHELASELEKGDQLGSLPDVARLELPCAYAGPAPPRQRSTRPESSPHQPKQQQEHHHGDGQQHPPEADRAAGDPLGDRFLLVMLRPRPAPSGSRAAGPGRTGAAITLGSKRNRRFLQRRSSPARSPSLSRNPAWLRSRRLYEFNCVLML